MQDLLSKVTGYNSILMFFRHAEYIKTEHWKRYILAYILQRDLSIFEYVK